jgi:hypothetical protein
LAFDGKLLGHMVRIFTDTVSTWYRHRVHDLTKANGKGRIFYPAPPPSQEDIENLVEKVSKRILRFLERRGVITLVAAPDDGEVTVVTDETIGEEDPLLAKLLAAATAGAAQAVPAKKRQPIHIVVDPDERPSPARTHRTSCSAGPSATETYHPLLW